MALKYVGKGIATIHGVPARDLTAEEAAEFKDIIDAQQALTGLILYKPPTKAKRQSKTKEQN